MDITSINVCGLISKLLYPDFIDFVKAHDIVCIKETKIDELDVPNIKIDGFQFWSKHRNACVRKSGGIGAFVKSELVERKLVTVFNDRRLCDNVLWF